MGQIGKVSLGWRVALDRKLALTATDSCRSDMGASKIGTTLKGGCDDD